MLFYIKRSEQILPVNIFKLVNRNRSRNKRENGISSKGVKEAIINIKDIFKDLKESLNVQRREIKN